MTKPVKFFLTSVGVIIGLMVFGMILSAIFRVQPEDIKKLNLITEMQWYRFGFYALVLCGWPWICKLMTRSFANESGLTEDEKSEALARRERDFQVVKSKWKSIALLILFFEIVVIRQFGL